MTINTRRTINTQPLLFCAILLIIAYFASGWIVIAELLCAGIMLILSVAPTGAARWLIARPSIFAAYSGARLFRFWPITLCFIAASGYLLFNSARKAALNAAAPAVPAIGAEPAQPAPSRGQLPELAVSDIRVFGGEGSGPGQFREPHGIAIAPNGDIAIADTGNKRVQILNTNGQFIRELKQGREPFLQPMAVAYTKNGDLVVLDSERASIERFSADGKIVNVVDKLGYFPRGMYLDKDDNYLIADTGGSRVIRVAPSGQVLFGWGEKGKGAGQWIEPTDVLEDKEGNVYAVDPTIKLLQKFSTDGSLLASVSIESASSFHGPKVVLLDDGRLLVSAPESHVVRIYNEKLKPVSEFGGPGAEPGKYRLPTSLAKSGNTVFVADSVNHRIQRLTPALNE